MTPEFPEAQAPHVRRAIAKARASEYLKQRDAEDVAARAKLMNERLERIRNRLDGSRFAPHVVGEVTMRAVVDLLESLGYTANGRVNAATENKRTAA